MCTQLQIYDGLGPGADPFLDPGTWDTRSFSSSDLGRDPFLNMGSGTWGTLRGANRVLMWVWYDGPDVKNTVR
jgi:hypothetical protein